MIGSLIGKLVFGVVLSGFAAIALLLWARQTRASQTLRRRLGQLRAEGDALVREAGGDEEESSLAQMVAESGLGWTMGMFFGRLAAAVGAGLLVGLLFGSGLLALVFGGGGGLVLWLVVRQARNRRLTLCDEQMPQALEVMALALRAGHALPSALQLAAQESPAPLCHELARAADEHALGRPIGDVLAAVAARLPRCDAVNTFVVAVLVLQETGGNLIEVIDRIVDNARARSSYQARLRALTSEGRQSAKLLSFLPGAFLVLVLLMEPDHVHMLLFDSGGRIVAAIALTLWVTGILWTRRLVRPPT